MIFAPERICYPNRFRAPGLISLFCIFYFTNFTFAQGNTDKKDTMQAITINGDTMEYSTDGKEATAKGNVTVTYRDTKLTCQTISVDTQSKEATAEGDVRIEDSQGIIEGAKILYNFKTKTGTILDAHFMATPYFGRARKMDRVSEAELAGINGYITTCNFNHPHYRINSQKINVFPGDKIQTKNNKFYLGDTPLAYLPRYNHSLKDPMMHTQFMPGKRKDWGPYLLTATRYNLTPHLSGRLYLDYRDNLGVAEGFGANYANPNFGRGDFKYYYAQERVKDLPESSPAEFQRYLIRWRHNWDINPRTNLVSEYYKINDSKRVILGSDYNLLKDYFFREYERDSQPLSYVLTHHLFDNSSLDVLVQKRTNRWYSQLEKLPEIKYSLPSLQFGKTPLYFENNSSAANFNYKSAVPSDATNDISLLRFDTTNKILLPARIAFVNITPFVANRQTFYDRDLYGSSVSPRNIFYTGCDLTTKFYRLLNVKSNFLGLDINGLRHIITPTIGYAYNYTPSIRSERLKQIDAVDSIDRSNSLSLELSNKLQTKRKGITIDFLDLRINSKYIFYEVDPTTNAKSGGSFSDFLLNLKLLPYSWMRVDADATYKPQGDYFSEVNPSVSFDFGKERTLSFGHRYQRKGSKEMTFASNWRLNPKWKIGIYERYELARISAIRHGWVGQQYTISRDLHCWEMDVAYSVERGQGNTIWLIFRLKAFPEIEFNFDQSYNTPKSGSQSNP